MENTLKAIRSLLLYSNHRLIGYNAEKDLPKYSQSRPSRENSDIFIRNDSVIEIQDSATASSNDNHNNLLCYETLNPSTNNNSEFSSRKKKFRNSLEDDEIENLEEVKILKAKCELCPQRFKSQKGLKIHMNKVHPVSQRSYCHICGKYFSNDGSLTAHKSQVHYKSTRVICETCGKEVCNKYSLALHKQKKHPFLRPL
ncbi:unnamed protein product [Blepharisma stoltei]|uniref:C2H2-type domain-containing protein n=1 Tax=Blepharisma stoltei TaxID=1481888 RepID=A0AAU9JT62_9CILI|nr:unnamed protein product [Blepharisma stoltei]